MGRDGILELLRARRPEIEAFGVKSLSVFGSVARDEDTQSSDVDVLVGFVGRATFDNYMGLKFYLEDLLGRRVDLVTQRALRPRLRRAVEQDLIHVA